MATPATLSIKRGDTFSYSGTVVLGAGTWTAASQLRLPNKVNVNPPVGVLTVTLGNAGVSDGSTPLSILLFADAIETGEWPVSISPNWLECDVQFTDNSGDPVVVSTATFTVAVLQDITHA